MIIRIECYLAVLKKYKMQFPNAHFEVITRTAKSELSPSRELLSIAKDRKMDFETYKKLFLEEILSNPDALIRIGELRQIAKEKVVYLICYELDASKCHRSIVKEIIMHPKGVFDNV